MSNVKVLNINGELGYAVPARNLSNLESVVESNRVLGTDPHLVFARSHVRPFLVSKETVDCWADDLRSSLINVECNEYGQHEIEWVGGVSFKVAVASHVSDSAPVPSFETPINVPVDENHDDALLATLPANLHSGLAPLNLVTDPALGGIVDVPEYDDYDDCEEGYCDCEECSDNYNGDYYESDYDGVARIEDSLPISVLHSGLAPGSISVGEPTQVQNTSGFNIDPVEHEDEIHHIWRPIQDEEMASVAERLEDLTVRGSETSRPAFNIEPVESAYDDYDYDEEDSGWY